jgi:dynein assembly factor 5
LDIVEPSEEIRLLLLTSLVAIVDRAGPIFAPGVEEAVKILSRTLLDPFPDVKKVFVTAPYSIEVARS